MAKANPTEQTKIRDVCDILGRIAAIAESQSDLAERLIAESALENVHDGVVMESLAKQLGLLAETALQTLGDRRFNFGATGWLVGHYMTQREEA